MKSQKSTSEKNFDRILNLYDKALTTPNNKLEEIKLEIKNNDKLAEIHNALVEVKTKLDNNPNGSDAIKYKLLGDKWSTEYLDTINPNILTKDGKLYFKYLLEFHKSIFPNDFPWAGKFRNHDVIVNNSFMTMPHFETSGSVDYILKPITALDVEPTLRAFCDKWNNNLDERLLKSTDKKIQIVAEFFHEFQVIHPFTDGNGRVGRILLEDMVKFLLNKTFKIQTDRESYYNSLRLADMGSIDNLKKLIEENLE